MINHDSRERIAGNMEPETKLLVAIMGAIGAYIQMEQQSFPPTAEVKPEPDGGRGRFPDAPSSTRAQKS